MFEHRHQPMITHRLFLRRMISSFAVAFMVIGMSLVIGIFGYHFIVGLGWVDAFLNASMILSGMGPVNEIRGNGAKIFAGVYALFSGVVFLSTAAILFAPLVHRLLHHFHHAHQHDRGGDSRGARPPAEFLPPEVDDDT